MKFELDPLPYAKNALAPHLTEETLSFHYEKHHQAYMTNLKKLLVSFGDDQNGYANLAAMTVGLVGAGNGTNSFGHFLRSSLVVPLASCVFYSSQRNGGCAADFAEKAGDNNEPTSKSSQAPTSTSTSSLEADAASLDYLLGSGN